MAERTRELTENNRLLAEEVVQRQQAERTLLQTQDELIQAAKMAVVGQAMTSLAHELNQPLSAMMTYLYTSRTALAAGQLQALDQDLGKLDKLGRRMSRIINALRHFARKSPVPRRCGSGSRWERWLSRPCCCWRRGRSAMAASSATNCRTDSGSIPTPCCWSRCW